MNYISTSYNRITDLFTRHKKKILLGFGVGAIAGGYLLYQKFKPIYDQIRSELAMMEKLSGEMGGDSQAKQQLLLNRFAHNMIVGDETLKTFANQAKIQISRRYDLDLLRSQMKKTSATDATSSSSTSSSLSHKAQLEQWSQFKIAGFTRTLSGLYTTILLHSLIKIQLSIVSRYVWSDSNSKDVQSNANTRNNNATTGVGPAALPPPVTLPAPVSEEINKCYFALSEHAQTRGLEQLEDAIQEAVTQVVGRWELSTFCSFSDLQTVSIQTKILSKSFPLMKIILQDIRGTLEFNLSNRRTKISRSSSAQSIPISSPFASFLLPSSIPLNDTISHMNDRIKASVTSFAPAGRGVDGLSEIAVARLQEMTAETGEVINSPSFSSLLSSSIDSSFSVLFHLMQPIFTSPTSAPATTSSNSLTTNNSSEPQIPFANAMVRLFKLYDIILPINRSDSSPLFDSFSADEPTKRFCAVIFFPLDDDGNNIYWKAQQKHESHRESTGVLLQELSRTSLSPVREQRLTLVEEEKGDMKEGSLSPAH